MSEKEIKNLRESLKKARLSEEEIEKIIYRARKENSEGTKARVGE